MPLNYYAINRILGATMVPGPRARFGGFGLLGVAGSALGKMPREPKPMEFTYDLDAKVAKAFEAVREGKAPERVLWDGELARRFHRLAKELGVHATTSQIDRRLLTIRKAPGRFRQHGIELSPSTVVDPKPSIVAEYAHVIEFALVKLKYRYGASIDDILLDSKLVEEYEQIARQAAGNLTSTQLRLGALYIRKTRHVPKNEGELFAHLDAAQIEPRMDNLGVLATVKLQDVPASEGLIEVLERDRYLYIARNENLRAVVEQFTCSKTLDVMANHFWKPQLDTIRLRAFQGSSFLDQSVRRWQIKLIQEKTPVFNWPVSQAA